jgi:hypothetical protein
MPVISPFFRTAGEVSADDKAYLVQLVAARTWLSQPEATTRVDAVLAQVQVAKAKIQQAADAARKVSAIFALRGALLVIIGAFIASVAAALGGRQRLTACRWPVQATRLGF